MTTHQQATLAGTAAGALWALLVVWGGQKVSVGFIPLPMVVPIALVVPGLILMAMIGRIAARRIFDDTAEGGAAPAPAPDQRVLADTVEQAVLALLTWPVVTFTLGGPVVLVMSVAFGLARVVYWAGGRRAPALRAFGFAATFLPTVLATLWALAVWLW